jgi:hypothetical protein
VIFFSEEEEEEEDQVFIIRVGKEMNLNPAVRKFMFVEHRVDEKDIQLIDT